MRILAERHSNERALTDEPDFLSEFTGIVRPVRDVPKKRFFLEAENKALIREGAPSRPLETTGPR